MFNQQGSFSVQSFPSKLVDQSSQGVPWSPNAHEPPNLASSSQSTVAGPSSTKSTASLAPADGLPVNLTAYVKLRTEEEAQAIHTTAAGFAACLTADHAAVLHPDVDTPFRDAVDVVHRLLPYHVFQQPDEDLKLLLNRKRPKGKEKAKYHEFRQEIEDTRFALHCHKQLKRLQDRFYRAKIRSGSRPSPDGQAYILSQSILELERAETATLSSELRSARNELDAIQREKRVASTVVAAHPTVTTFRPTYYAPTAPSQYYRAYSYAYTQPYSTGAQSTSMFYSPPSAIPQPPPSTSSYTPSTGPIPVQLPVTSLSALHALGIVPIPAASLPPLDQPQPAAVLKGSTSNGTMLSLEINVSLLQSAQMSGLAILLNSLMSRGPGHAQTSTAVATCQEQSQQNGVSSVAANAVPITTHKEGDGTG